MYRLNHWSRDHSVICGLLLLWVLVVTLVNPSGNFPLNDDWVYGLAVRNILQTGQFRFVSPASANLFTQAYWGALFCLPLGFSFFALRLSTLVLAGLGVISLYSFTRELGCTRGVSILAGLLLIFNPMYLGLSNSFMTDVPFTALIVIALYFFAVALMRNDRILLFACYVAAFLALGIRQYGLIFIGAITVGYLVKKGLRCHSVLYALGAFALAVGLQLTYTTWLVNSGQIIAKSDMVIQFIRKGGSSWLEPGRLHLLLTIFVYVGAFTLPLLFIYQRCTFKRVKATGISLYRIFILAFTIFSALQLGRNQLPRLGNILTVTGMGPLTLRDTFILSVNLPTQSLPMFLVWMMLTICAALGVVLIVTLIAQSSASLIQHMNLASFPRYRSISATSSASDRPWLLATLWVSILAYATLLALASPLDRYLLPLYPLVIMLAAYYIRDRFNSLLLGNLERSMILLVICLYVYFSVGASHDYMAWNRARWQALNDLTSKYNISPALIDGGYEFNGWHLSNIHYKPSSKKSFWWVDRDDYIVATGPVNGYKQLAIYPFRRWLPVTSKPITLLKKVDAKR